jgi:hypothetical protein
MEIGVARRSNSFNRWFVYRLNGTQLDQIAAGGADWGSGYYATAIAFGDADGDGKDEVAVGRRANESGRYYLFDDALAPEPFKRLAIGGSPWGSGNYTTDLAFGDTDADGRDELGVTRRADSDQRFEIVSYANGGFTQDKAGGQIWGAGHYGSAIAFGNVDNDPGEEVLVGRVATESSRFYVLDDQSGQFAVLDSGGDTWGSGYYTVGVALADVDGDKLDEVIVARNAGEHGRYYVNDDQVAGFAPLTVTGVPLLDGIGATDVAAGDVDGNGKADLIITYDEDQEGGRRYEVLYMN